MSSFIMRIEDYYCIWSINRDRPISYVRTLPDFVEWYIQCHSREEMSTFNSRLFKAIEYGTSFGNSAGDYIRINRAGRGNKKATIYEIIREFGTKKVRKEYKIKMGYNVEAVVDEEF